MATTTQINSRIELAVTKAEKTQEAYLKVLSSEGQQDIKLSDGTFTPNLNKRLADHVNRVKSVAGKTGDVTGQDIKDSLNLGSAADYDVNELPVPQGVDGRIQTAISNLNLGSASQKDVEFFAEQEKQADKVVLGSGRTVESKLSENPNPIDYGAVGDGVTDDTQAFIDFEKIAISNRVDLLGKTYLVSRSFDKNYYYNGRFYVNDGYTFLIEANSTNTLDCSYIKNGGYGKLISRLDNFNTQSSGLAPKISQGTVYDLYTGESFTMMPDETDSTLNRLEKHIPSKRFVSMISRSSASNQMGHQGLAIQYIKNTRKFWTCAGYSTVGTKGLKLNRLEWDGVDGSSFTNVEEFKVFPETKNDGIVTSVMWANANSVGVSPNNQVLVTNCQYYLKGSKTEWQTFIRVFNTDVFKSAGDYSNQYVYEFPIMRFSENRNTVQATATDGKYVYVLIGESTSARSARVLVYTLDGALVINDPDMQVGFGAQLNNYYEPESFCWLPTSQGLKLGFAIGTKRYAAYQCSTILAIQGGFGRLLSPTDGSSKDYAHGGILFDSEKTFKIDTINEDGSQKDLYSFSATGLQTNLSDVSNYLTVRSTTASNSGLRAKNLNREGLFYVSNTGMLGIYDTTNSKWLINLNIDGTLATIPTKTHVNGDLSIKPSKTVSPTNNGELTFEATSDTSVTVKLKGSDGVVRSAVLTLA